MIRYNSKDLNEAPLDLSVGVYCLQEKGRYIQVLQNLQCSYISVYFDSSGRVRNFSIACEKKNTLLNSSFALL